MNFLTQKFAKAEIDKAIEVVAYSLLQLKGKLKKITAIWLLDNEFTPTEYLEEIFKHLGNNKDIRYKLVRHPNINQSLLKKISKSKSFGIFIGILENESIDQKTKDLWMNDNTLLRHFWKENRYYKDRNYFDSLADRELLKSSLTNDVKNTIKNRCKESYDLWKKYEKEKKGFL